MLGQAYEYLLKQFADESGKKAGEFFTPRRSSTCSCGILDPQPERRSTTPASGSGGMLVETINAVDGQGRGPRHAPRAPRQEVNLTTSAIARMNLFLHEIEDFGRRAATRSASPASAITMAVQQFDVIIANPPFSLQNWGADTWPADPRALLRRAPAKNGDYAWIQHMVASMNAGNGARRRGHAPWCPVPRRSEARIRQCLG